MTDYQAKQRQRNMIVGSFVIIALCAFFYMLFRFRDLPQVVSKFNSFEILVYFPEAPGVQKDTPVQYCGYQIGRVVKVAPPQMRGGSHKAICVHPGAGGHIFDETGLRQQFCRVAGRIFRHDPIGFVFKKRDRQRRRPSGHGKRFFPAGGSGQIGRPG
jgi:hypothetical protein